MNKFAAALALEQYWAIDPGFAERMMPVALATKAEGGSEPLVTMQPGYDAENGVAYDAENGVAVIRIEGVLMRHVPSMGSGASTVKLRRAVRLAASDPRIQKIVLAITSPGGAVYGIGDLADDIATAAQVKPVVAFIEDQCASAAYWLAASATEIVASPQALSIGSIGVYTAIYDYSVAAEQEGVRPILISSGGVKGQGLAGLPIPDELVEHLQDGVIHIYERFTEHVATSRGMSEDDVLLLADGRTWPAQAALAHGLVDRIATWDEVCRCGESADNEMKIFGRKGPAADPIESAVDERDQLAMEALIERAATVDVAAAINGAIDANRLTAAEGKAFSAALIHVARAEGAKIAQDGSIQYGAAFAAVRDAIHALEPRSRPVAAGEAEGDPYRPSEQDKAAAEYRKRALGEGKD